MKRAFIPLTLLLGLLAVTAAASTTGSGWKRVSAPGAEASVGLGRVADGTLHVVWVKNGSAFDSRITRKGGAGSRSTVASGWASMSGPALVVQPDGSLRAFLSGSIEQTDVGPDVGIHTATASSSGNGWSVDPQAVWGGALANQRDVRAAIGKDGEPVTAVGGSGAVFFKGTTRGQNATVLPPKPYSYDPEIAVDGVSGAAIASWYIDQGGKRGIVTQPVFPGRGQHFIGAADEAVDTGVSGRIGAPGVYVVVSSPAGVRFGREGGSFRLVEKDGAVKAVDVTAGPDGRLWVAWLSTDGKLHATRSNRSLSRFGASQVVAGPSGSTAVALAGEGSDGPLDALARYSTGSDLAWWHRRIVPPLDLSARRDKKTAAVSVTVTDVGDPVAGVKVKAGGKTATTDAKGKATITNVASAGTARASADGYQPAADTFN